MLLSLCPHREASKSIDPCYVAPKLCITYRSTHDRFLKHDATSSIAHNILQQSQISQVHYMKHKWAVSNIHFNKVNRINRSLATCQKY